MVNARVRVLRENALCAHDIMYAGHYERSLLRDNDSRCYLRKMEIISSDWIVLLRRLLMHVDYCRAWTYSLCSAVSLNHRWAHNDAIETMKNDLAAGRKKFIFENSFLQKKKKINETTCEESPSSKFYLLQFSIRFPRTSFTRKYH